ncbi:putative complex, subunit [Trypoxylus dichotomus]
MIAATNPQEFIPSGRQQVLNHPGPVEPLNKRQDYVADDFLLRDFEKVSIVDTKSSEWWILRKTPNLYEVADSRLPNILNDCNKNGMGPGGSKSHLADVQGDSWSSKNVELNASNKRRTSDANSSKFLPGRFSSEFEGKSGGGYNFKTEPLCCKPTLNFMEEELYVKGNIVIWSKGLFYNNDEDSTRETICTYSSTYPVKHALWCNFYCERPTIESPLIPPQFKPDHPTTDPISCVTIIDGQTLKVFTVDNEDFITALPFYVSRVWNTKFGILLQRDISDESNRNKFEYQFPMIYSLSHPLDEVAPIALKGDIYHLVEEPLFQVVFTSEKPSICMAFDGRTGQHSVYRIKRLPPMEWIDLTEKSKSIQMESMFSSSRKKSTRLSFWDNFKNSIHLSIPSPFSNKTASAASAISQIPSRAQSPMASISRSHTPGATITHEITYFDNSQISFANPDLCLEHIWTDTMNITTGEMSLNCAASKVFLVDDMVGQSFLCYLLPTGPQLCLVKAEIVGDNVTFGMMTSVGAKDAIDIPSLHMLAVLEHSGNVVLYSGLNVVGKLHIGGVLPQHIPSPNVVQNMKQFNSPFPRRSSLLPTCGPSVPDIKFDEHLLSPVLPSVPLARNTNAIHLAFQSEGLNTLGDSTKIQLTNLRDPIENRITLQYSDGTYYRINLPLLATSKLVENAINALRETLPKDASMTLLTRWYSIRNAPGPTDVTVEKEWEMFSDLLFQLLGYEEDHTADISTDHTATPASSAKRLRQSCRADNSDWAYLQQSQEYQCVSHYLGDILNLNVTNSTSNIAQENKNVIKINHNSIFFPNIKIVHFTLHLLYEDLKLNVLRKNDLKLLADFLGKIAYDLSFEHYEAYYWKDFPEICNTSNYSNRNKVNPISLKFIVAWPCTDNKPVGIYQFLYDLLGKNNNYSYPYIRNVNSRSRDVIQLWGAFLRYRKDVKNETYLDMLVQSLTPPGGKPEPTQLRKTSTAVNASRRVVEIMTEMGLTTRELETYPPAINFLLYNAIWNSRENPPGDWPAESYTLLQRPDLAAQAQVVEKKKESSAFMQYVNQSNVQEILPTITQVEVDQEDGMEDVDSTLLKLRFPDDLRVAETRRLLQSSKPVSIVVVQRPDVSDHDFIEEQEKYLYALCTRTMALPVGRGMFTLRTASPVITEPLAIPLLCLSGKAPPRGTTVELNHIDVPGAMSVWPQFHNGVANGLRVTTDAHNIDSTWITFNKPNGNTEFEHAGFLMALGLNGHLKNLAILNTFDYLTKFQEMLSVGLLLGFSAAYRGTSNALVTKMLSIHVEALLPPTSMELDISQNVQVAGLLGIGLLYQGTAHRYMTEVLLTEIGRPPGPEMENSVDRESYSLAAGLALGLVTLGQGGKPSGLCDLNVSDTLHYYMVGGNKRSLTGSQKEKYKVASFQIREGPTVNLDVTAPGATLALGLMYIGTGNKAIADWMAPPDTQYLLDFVRPDFLTLRTLSRALIMWDNIKPTKDWIDSQVPETIRPHCMVKPSPLVDVDYYETMNQAYCNIIAGACFALGLRYAGSADQDAFQTLLHYCHMFTSLTMKSIAELAGKPTIEACLNLIVVSVAMVMAGTGNLDIMRIVRHLRRRVGVTTSVVVTYGSHLATHMALGLLFLGGGRYTLSNTPASVAALICAFYPKFPTHSNDNRYHLQAFRHLYVLAVEPRLLIPRDVMMGRMCYANIKVVKIDGTEINIKGPGLIPELSSLYKVCIADDRYWPVVFERGRNWELLEKVLNSYGCIEVKQRAGCLSYLEDKHGYRTELAHTLTQSNTVPWDPSSKAILSFSSDCTIRNFCDYFLSDLERPVDAAETKMKQNLTQIAYDCVIKDKLNVLPIFLSLVKVMKDDGSYPSSLQLWQYKLVHKLILTRRSTTSLISPEAILGLHYRFMKIFDGREKNLKEHLLSYLKGQIPQCKNDLLKSLVQHTPEETEPSCG